MGILNKTGGGGANKIDKIATPNVNDLAKINSNGEIENSNIQADDVELNTNKVASFQQTPNNTKYPTEKLVKDNLDLKENLLNKTNSFQETPDNTKYPSEKLVKDNLDLKADINNLKANSAVFVNSLIGNDNNNGLSLATPFETVGKGLTDVTNSGNVNILGSDTQSINHTFTSSQNSIKVSISDAFKISGTLNLVNGNTSMEFYNGKMNATITDDSTGTFYMNNVNVGGATLNFSRSGYKVIRGSTSTPTVINLTGSGGTLLLENVSGGVIPINIGTGWTVYVVNSLLGIGTNNGIVIDRSTTLTSVVTDQTTLNAITGTTNNTLDGLHLLNFSSPSVTGLTLKKGDIIYKVGQLHFLSYTFESAPDVVSKALSATTREVYYKDVDEWIKLSVASLSTKILNTREETSETSYGSNTDIETSTEIKSQGAITYANGLYTVGKDCTLLGSCTLTFRNNGAPSNDNSYLHIYKSTDNGNTFSSVTRIPIEPSNLIDSSQFLGQSFTDCAFDVNNGDKFKFRIVDVNLTQYISHALVTFKEQ